MFAEIATNKVPKKKITTVVCSKKKETENDRGKKSFWLLTK